MNTGLRGADGSAGFSARLAIVVAALLLIWFGRPAGAQACKDLAPGPAKKQCLMQNHPEGFAKKQERCKALADQRASDSARGHSKIDFMQSCMQGKVSP
jgi:hypothetical protein